MRSIKAGLIAGVFGLLIGGLFTGSIEVNAAEEEKERVIEAGALYVDISRNDGVKLTPHEDEAIVTGMQLNYSIDPGIVKTAFKHILFEEEKNLGADAQIDYRISYQYALSDDNGVSFGEWKDLSGGVFTFIPGTVTDGDYCIKFRKLEEYVLRPEETVQVSGNSISENKTEKAKAAEYEKSRKAAQKTIEKEPVHVFESACYRVRLDSVAPQLDLTMDKDPDVWTAQNIKCHVRVNDTGSRPEKLKISCGDSQILEETFSADSVTSGFEKEFTLSSETISDEGDELIIEAYDAAGNISTVTRRIKIDKTAPKIGIEGVDSGGIYDGAVKVLVTGEDVHPSTVCVGYTLKRVYDHNEETIESSAKTLYDLRDSSLVCVDQDGDYSLECRAVDAAGNEAPLMKCSFRIDKTSPYLGFEGVIPQGIFKGDVSLKIIASDNFDDSYKVRLSGSVATRSGTSDLKLAEYKTEGRYSQCTYYFKADGEYSLSACVTDSAGNSYEDTITFAIDKVSPVIDVGGVSLKEEAVTNVPPTISFKIKESNYENASVICVLKKKDQSGNFEVCQTPDWMMNGETTEFSITIDKEGDYELCVSASDAAGNMAVKTLRFTLDMTEPEIDYIENFNRKYIKSFKLPDNFSDYIKDDSGVDYRTYLNSMNYDEGEEINEDGKYILKVSAVDDAGNQAEKTVEFIVDATIPRVVIDGMADDGSVNKDDTLLLSLYDEDDYFTSVKLNGEELVTQTKQQEVEVTIPDYGDYTIEVEASDMADNILTQTIEAKCANAAPVAQGVSTMRTLKQKEKSGSNKGLRVFLIVLTVLVFAGAILVYYFYTVKYADKQLNPECDLN